MKKAERLREGCNKFKYICNEETEICKDIFYDRNDHPPLVMCCPRYGHGTSPEYIDAGGYNSGGYGEDEREKISYEGKWCIVVSRRGM